MKKLTIIIMFLCAISTLFFGCSNQQKYEVVALDMGNGAVYPLDTNQDYENFYRNLDFGVKYHVFCGSEEKQEMVKMTLMRAPIANKGTRSVNLGIEKTHLKESKFENENVYIFEIIFEK